MEDDNNPPAHQVAKVAQESLRQLFRERAEIASRIGTIKRTIAGLAKVFGDDLLNDELTELVDGNKTNRHTRCTNACRTILMQCGCALSAQEVRDLVQQRIPVALRHHKNPLASVTTILNRLVKSGEALTFHREDGLRVWRWLSLGTDECPTAIGDGFDQSLGHKNRPEDQAAGRRLRGGNPQ